ncbi:hypothetical protein [Thiobacillus denitrificans]|uniref:hypothetical protein n=1 Tax=Thiobacillus denitrificans TaxID=36861 RepID=UPI00036BA4D6|nr:hypothetical protein [Thiobacillus denitrificans]
MTTPTNIVVSISVAMVATNALASIRDTKIEIADASEVPQEVMQRIDAAVSKRNVREAVADAFGIISENLTEQGETIKAKYVPDHIKLALNQPSDIPGAQAAGACYTNCYKNCHCNCHGSRGWR